MTVSPLDSAAAPTAVAVLVAVAVVLTTRPRPALGDAAWGVVAGVAGALTAAAALSGELLTVGLGGLIVAALASAAGTGGALVALRPAPEAAAARGKGDGPERPGRTGPTARPVAADDARRRAVVVAAVGALVLLLTVVGLSGPALLLLVLAGAAGLVRGGWGVSSAAVLAAAAVTVAVVVVGQYVLSPLGLVGRPLATVTVALLALLPPLWRAADRATWAWLRARTGLADAAVLAVSAAVGLAWWSLFQEQSDAESVSQLLRLGEDNITHLLLLQATSDTGVAVGESAASREQVTAFAGYFPGPSLWQASWAGLLPSASSTSSYVTSTACLLALLTAAATAAAAQLARRSSVLAAAVVLGVGAVGGRVVLALFEYGFPGQLLAAFLLCAALLLLCRDAAAQDAVLRPWGVAVLVLATVTAVSSWSLIAPVLAAPLLVLLGAPLLRWARTSLPTSAQAPAPLAALVTGAALLVAGAGWALRSRGLAVLDTLTVEGAVFRAVPVWVPVLLLLSLPVAARAARTRLPLAATVLGTSSAAAFVALLSWQVLRTGAVTYYGYKLQYFVLCLAWAGAAAVGAVAASERERAWHPAVRGLVAGAVVLVALPVLQWPQEAYRGWLQARAALGPDPVLACAGRSADRVAPGAAVLGVGFGAPLGDYLATKSMAPAAGTGRAFRFLQQQANDLPPDTWPWQPGEQVVLVPGPEADPADLQAIGAAATAVGAQVQVAPACAREAA